MSEQADERQFNPRGVTFPTDGITLRQMRDLEPHFFTSAALSDGGPSSADAMSTHYWELMLAEKAFARALGRPDPHPEDDREQIITELLNEAYMTYGLSSGIEDTRRLVGTFEAEAKRQAGQYRQRGR